MARPAAGAELRAERPATILLQKSAQVSAGGKIGRLARSPNRHARFSPKIIFWHRVSTTNVEGMYARTDLCCDASGDGLFPQWHAVTPRAALTTVLPATIIICMGRPHTNGLRSLIRSLAIPLFRAPMAHILVGTATTAARISSLVR